ncbi:metal tolerance protein 9-like [Prunus yedoensis var. nudiflora]|uniref:Metal tolerance protein 9-like n=1 Tax=Prunus yedoensis var. nudiflora TaxID=2094558 RepID=A0A314YCF8_PRUYE|nr:metal tolerance protein 9-like [Prunus yedoensis var. nudiflora]
MDKSPPSSGGTSDNRMEPLLVSQDDAVPGRSSWRLNVKEFRLHQQSTATTADHDKGRRRFALRRLCTPKRQYKVEEYYKQQERLLEGFTEMETMTEEGCLPGSLTEDQIKQLAKSERMAVHVSNIANLVLFAAKVYASIMSRSLAVIASTLDSLLDLLSGFILWFTAHAMKSPNQYHYPIGKKRMQPVGIIVFASVMATLGLQILLESARELISQASDPFFFPHSNLKIWTNKESGQVSDSESIALYTINTWAKTVLENVHSLIGRTAPPYFLAKLTYLIWNHHEEIRHIDTVRAYTFGTHYFVEVDIVLPEDMLLNKAHNIGETLQEKLERLPEVERAFVHIDFEFSHRPEHKNNV